MGSATAVVPGSTARHATRVFLSGIAGCVAALLGAVGVFSLGAWIGAIDARHHVPGHVIYGSLMAVPALVQLLYVVPLYKLARRRGAASLAVGLIVGSLVVGLANAAVLVLLHQMSQVD